MSGLNGMSGADGGEIGHVEGGPTEAGPAELEAANIAARHQIAHALASPARGAAIVADLLTEALEAPELDVDLLRELSVTLTSNVEDLQGRLEAFREGRDT